MKSVLVVDDSEMDRFLAGRLLEKDSDYTVSYAVDGQDALAQLDLHQPDVILTDLNMPEMDGFQLVQAVRKKCPQIPVVLMTAEGSEEIATQALRSGAASYVPKKKLAAELFAVIEQVARQVQEEQAQQELQQRVQHHEVAIQVENELRLLRALAGWLQELCCDFLELDDADRLRLRVAIEEALAYAMYHGNLELPMTGQSAAELQKLGQERKRQLPYRHRKLHVLLRLSPDQAMMVIRDEGPARVPPQITGGGLVAGDSSAGRGLTLVQAFLDDVRFHPDGNSITLTKRAPTNTSGLSGLMLMEPAP